MDDPKTLDALIQWRIDGLSAWLSENAPGCHTEQRHLDEGGEEHAYWIYGYLTALRDLQEAIKKRRWN